ncbi:MAG: hypothetical protein KJ698_08430 [Actinobacteria bacterium]|nr:hypothetical protein [Actinomycetota bacterium]MBU1492539.1 hypothetical protein [Actinomycetota bacterium]MBU1865521.1 hypothetical protein [Actinomycetota bacterium]
MRRMIPVLALVLAVTACSGDGAASTSSAATVSTAATTTTMDVRLCDGLADEAARWVGDLVTALEGIRYEVLIDRSLWSEDLVRLDEAGAALQAESDAAGCDEGLIRGAVVQAASQMQTDSAAARMLLELLVPTTAPEGTG